MSKKPILLSISMLVSGREEMAKSLASLQPLKAAFPCEIVLVDTGCSPEQRALAESYADKVVDYVWNGDFAAARNAGVRETHGEWFMYMDDDEWLDDPQEIVDFFTSDEHTKYNCATYAVRNYFNAQGTMYDDSYPSRLCRREPETKFLGKIHEFITTYKPPKKVFSTFAHHYGYVYKSDEEKKKHAERNIQPLLEMIEIQPFDPRWIAQLAQEYYNIDRHEDTYEVCRRWLEEQKDLKADIRYVPTYLGCVYAFALISLHTMGRYEEAERWLEKALNDPLNDHDFMEPTTAFFHVVGARLFAKMGKLEECREHTRKYLDSVRRLGDDKPATEQGSELIVSAVFQENMRYGTALTVIGSIIRLEDYELAEEVFYILDWNDRRLLNQVDTEREIVDAISSVEWHPMWTRILQTLVSREDGMREMYVVFLEAELKYKQAGEREKLMRLRRAVSRLDHDHSYILCTKLLWLAEDPEGQGDPERLQKAGAVLDTLFQNHPYEILEIKNEIWNAVRQLEISVEPQLLKMDFSIWRRCLENWRMTASLQELQRWESRVSSWQQTGDIRYDLFRIKCKEGYLRLYRESAPSFRELEWLLWNYAEEVLKFYSSLYRDTAFDEGYELLPEEVQLAFRLKELRDCRERKEDLQALTAVRKCIGVSAVLEEAAEAYAGQLRDEIQRQDQEAEDARAELGRLAESLKAAAKKELEGGRYETAREILTQVCRCAPEDREAAEMLEQVERSKDEER